MADDAFKQVNNQLSRGAASPFPKKGGKDDKKADVKKGVIGACQALRSDRIRCSYDYQCIYLSIRCFLCLQRGREAGDEVGFLWLPTLASELQLRPPAEGTFSPHR